MSIVFAAEPWWVNLAVLIPVAAYLYWRRSPTGITARQLTAAGIFACAFGFLEATVVVYLRAATGLLPGFQGALVDVARPAPHSQLLREFPPSLLRLEVLRESATLLMLMSLASLTSIRAASRAAIFLWTFGIWDIIYYVSLWATIGWPQSLNDGDVLFLIPEPWFAPVWFPLLVSALTLLAILLTRTTSNARIKTAPVLTE